jgi:hypothetical protein
MAFPAGFQQGAGGFQNDCDGGPKGFQCQPTMPKPGVEVKRVYIDSTVELMADHFNLELASPTTLFSQAPALKTVAIQLGLLQGCTTPQLITQIQNGVIDEYELQIKPKEQILRVRGRDAMSNVLDCEFNKTYIRAEYNANGTLRDDVQAQVNATAAKTVTFADGTVINIPATVYELGVFTAKNVVQDICNKVGLQLLWQVRDYELQSTFGASGRAIDSIRKLVEPWAQIEAYRADIFVQGITLIVRHRQLPTQPFQPQQGYIMDISSMKRGELTIRKRAMKAVGALKLVGRLQQIKTNFVTVVNDDGEDEVDVTQTTIVPPTGSDTTEKKIVTQTRYLMPQQVVVRQFKDVFAPHKVEHQEIFNDYIDTDVGKLLSVSRSTTDKWDESISSLASFERTTIFNTYDDDTFLLRNQTTVFEQVDPLIATYVSSKMIVKQIVDIAPNMAEERVTEYAPSAGMSDGADAAAGSAFWDVVRQDSQIQAGHRAGGSGRKTIFIPNFPGSKTNIEIDSTVNGDKCAASVAYSNPNLTYQDLLFLQSLYTAANLLTFEWEVQFTGVAMPWLQKGTVIKITGVTGPWGDPVDLPPMYITEVRTTYDESKKDPEFVSQARAFAWL